MNTSSKPTLDHPLKGILLICCAVFLFAASDALSKFLTQFYPVVMVLWVRYIVHTGLLMTSFLRKSGFSVMRSKRVDLQIVRGICMVSTNMLFISALHFIPLAEGTAIIYIAPLIVAACSWPFLGERVSRSQWFAIVIGFIGVLIIVRPGGTLFTPVALLAVGAAFSFSIYQLVTRKLSGIDSSTTSNFISGLISSLVTTAILPFYWAMPADVWHGLLMIGLGISALASHLLMTRAYDYAKPSTLAPFTYGQLIFAGLIGYLLFGHMPDQYALLGITIICISGLMVAWGQRKNVGKPLLSDPL
jgi:drug/metabolite transporter (DMT)-like permease